MADENKPEPTITGITIRNFKGFGDKPIHIPIRPVTLLFGENSAGKSTILHALLYLREIIASGRADATSFNVSGIKMELGDFQRIVHQHDTARDISLRLDFSLSGAPNYLLDNLKGYPEPAGHVIPVGNLIELDRGYIECVIGVDAYQRPHVMEFTVGINNAWIARNSIYNRKDPHQDSNQCTVNLDHPVINAACEKLPGIMKDVMFFREHKSNTLWVTDSETHGVPLIPRLNETAKYEYLVDIDDISVYDYASDDQETLCNLVEQALVGCTAIALSLLSDTRYIGPLRNIPRGRVTYSDTAELPWATGEAAWQALVSPKENLKPKRYWIDIEKEIKVIDDNDFEERLKFMLNLHSDAPYKDDYFLNLINSLMSGLDFAYELRGVRKRHLDIDAGEYFRLKSVSGLDVNGQDAILQEFTKHIDKLPVYREFILVDKRSGAELDPDQVGSGISQLLPVVVGALAGPVRGLFAVEQPELHLHPRMQAKLGALLVQLAGHRKHPILVETHSEHLILRILRLIREGNKEALATQHSLLNNNLMVIYVDHGIDGIVVTEIPVDEEGEFSRPWPKGFFEERFEELL